MDSAPRSAVANSAGLAHPRPPKAVAPYGAGWAELALALGGLSIGTAEFAAMGILPNVAGDLHISVPEAGHLISAYALGVVVGAPLITVLLARMQRQKLLIGLMLVYAAANLLTALLHHAGAVVLSRFVAGLPHGAYFGVASIVAAALVPSNQRGEAIGKVMLGLAVANVVGVPAATWLGQLWGWRATFVAVSLLALATAVLIALVVPKVPVAEGASALTELGAFRRLQVWLTLLAAAIGFGGIFAVYSYITPLLTEVTRLSMASVPFMLGLLGIGMIVGNMLCGWFADRWLRATMLGMYGMTAVVLVMFVFAASSLWTILPVLLLLGMSSAVTPAFQSRLMDVAGDAQSLAAALNHSAFNLANALGAWLGGLAIAAGFGWTSTGWVGLALTFGGMLVLLISFALEQRTAAAARR